MINPIRLKGKPANIARYYTVGDYYTKAADEHSEWGGKIAAELGLEGRSIPPSSRSFLPARLVINSLAVAARMATSSITRAGISRSTLRNRSRSWRSWQARIIRRMSRRSGRARLPRRACHNAASRRREVVEKTTGRLIYARFTEHASRELDPHLHTHVVVMNITDERDGSKKVSLETRACSPSR
jgi:conjugative relaxase-like TrwC/TraI family protein